MADHAPARDIRARPDLAPVRNTDPQLRTGARVTTTDDGRLVATVELHGELCAATAPMLAVELERLVSDGITHVTLDVTQLTLCTSDGLDLWEHIHERLCHRDGTGVEVCGARGVVRRVLQIVCEADPSFSASVMGLSSGSDRTVRVRPGDRRG